MIKFLIKRFKEQDKRLLLHRFWGLSIGLFLPISWNIRQYPLYVSIPVTLFFLYFMVFGETHFFNEEEDKECLQNEIK